MTSSHTLRRLGASLGMAAAGVLAFATVLTAHDFWLVPNPMPAATDASLEILGQSGTRFPTSSGATQPAQVAEARIVGRSSDDRITDLSVAGKSLMLRAKPSKAGQYLVGVALASRTARTTPARLQRYIALEGAPELAARYEQEGKYPKADSVTQMSAKFAKTIVEVGAKGPRAFDKPFGHALEIVPGADPASLRAGDSATIRLLFRGKPVAGVHLRAGWGSPSAVSGDVPADSGAARRPDQIAVTGKDGRAKIAVTEAGLWNVRTLYAAPMTGMPEHWEVYFATLVFSVAGGAPAGDDEVDAPRVRSSGPSAVEALVPRARGSQAGSDSAAAVAVADRFHAALAAGDSLAALALLSDDVAILESGGAETLADYRAHHLAGDIAFASAVPSQRAVTGVHVQGDVAWVTSSSTTQGEFRGRQVNSVGAELMVLSRERGTWKIRAIHWSSRTRRPS